MSGRLKSAYNPFSVLPPVPVQISEAIMTFQEKGPEVSNTILLECFTSGFRLRRDTIESGDRYTVVDDAGSQQDEIRLAEQRFSKTVELRRDIGSFVDKALRFKAVWKNFPVTICDDLAFASVDDEHCWNGTASAPYNSGEAPEGVALQR
ncbi:GPN-1 protein [Aphelenchoides avenae]|nr:GPN-1 protein [Aphelenchus avenae]